jgi:hypothetical protein
MTSQSASADTRLGTGWEAEVAGRCCGPPSQPNATPHPRGRPVAQTARRCQWLIAAAQAACFVARVALQEGRATARPAESDAGLPYHAARPAGLAGRIAGRGVTWSSQHESKSLGRCVSSPAAAASGIELHNRSRSLSAEMNGGQLQRVPALPSCPCPAPPFALRLPS